MGLGGLLSMLDKRYRRKKPALVDSPVAADSMSEVIIGTATTNSKASEA